MTRKGYRAEYLVKKELIEKYGKYNVIKVAISQMGSDFLVVGCGELIKLVEVKETKKKTKYFSEREKKQMREIIKFAQSHNVPAELVIVFRRGRGKSIIKHYLEIYKPK